MTEKGLLAPYIDKSTPPCTHTAHTLLISVGHATNCEQIIFCHHCCNHYYVQIQDKTRTILPTSDDVYISLMHRLWGGVIEWTEPKFGESEAANA